MNIIENVKDNFAREELSMIKTLGNNNKTNYYLLKIITNKEDAENEIAQLKQIKNMNLSYLSRGYDPIITEYVTDYKNDDKYYIIMNLPENNFRNLDLYSFIFKTDNLVDWETDEDNLNLKYEINIMLLLLLGLSRIHDNNLIHGSVNLYNIIIGNDNLLYTNIIGSTIQLPTGIISPELFYNKQPENLFEMYKSIDIFNLGLVLLMILNKKNLDEKFYNLTNEQLNEEYKKLYSNPNWINDILEIQEVNAEKISFKNSILDAKNKLRNIIHGMLDLDYTKRSNLKKVINDVIQVKKEMIKTLKYFKQRRTDIIKIEKERRRGKKQNLDERSDIYKKNIKLSKNIILLEGVALLDKKYEDYIKLIENLEKELENDQIDKKKIGDIFRKIAMLKGSLIKDYTDEYNKTNTQRYKKQIDDIELKYISIKNRIEPLLQTGGTWRGKESKQKLRELRKILNGGGIKKIGEYFFEENEPIGSGTYGRVYMGWDNDNSGIYIIKKMDKTINSMNEILNLKEIKRLNRNRCFDNILCYHDHIEDDDYIYLITTYVENTIDLFDLIDTKYKKLSLLEKVIIISNIVESIKTIHDLNIAHSDIKPENILINPDNLQIQLIDFGGSCNGNYFDRCTVLGTIDYGSPEYLNALLTKQFNLGNIEKYKASDIFSIGIIFYLLTNNNRLPIDSLQDSDDKTLVVKNLLKMYSRDIKSNSGNDTIDNLINKMLQYDYKSRPKVDEIMEEMTKITFNLLSQE